MFPIWNVGSLALQVPGLIWIAGLWIGLTLAERKSKFFHVPSDLLYNLVFTALISGLIGARLAYFARFPAQFLEKPIDLLSIRPGLFDFSGGMAAAALGFLIYIRRKNLPYMKTLDALVPFFATMAIAIGLANLSSGNGYGTPTDSPLGIHLWGQSRHPVQVYEILAGAAILVLVWPIESAVKNKIPGLLFYQFLTLASFARVLLEGFRGDSLALPNGIRLAQIIAWLLSALALWSWYYFQNKSNTNPEATYGQNIPSRSRRTRHHRSK